MDYDVVVVGAGVVGLACARALSGRGLLVVEKHARFGQETSSRNSGVIHAGIYHSKESLKTRLCVRGNRSLSEYCEQRGVPFARFGKFIVATSPEEEAPLEKLLARAHENGAVEVERASLARLAAEEPNVRAVAALWSPRTGVVDVEALMRSYLAESRGDFLWRHRLVAARREADGWRLTLEGPDGARQEVGCARVVNAAGLDAAEIATLGGFGYSQLFVKGNYFRLRKKEWVSHLIYPVPPPDHLGVGVHVTLELDGSARLGPDVEPLANPADPLRYVVDEGRRESFFQAASRYLAGLSRDDLSPDQAGIRPKVKGGDFIIEATGNWVNLIGIESPGLTCSLEIAARVSELLP